LNKVRVNSSDLVAWSDVLHFGVNILRKPARTGTRHNLASIIKKRTEETGSGEQPRTAYTAPYRKRDATDLLAAAVTAKVNLKAAIRILCSEEKPATDIDATYAKLIERHPVPPNNRIPAVDQDDITAIQVSEVDVMHAIRTFPAGSSGGPDGLRPQHVLDLVTCPQSGSALLTAITALVNSLLAGKCNPAVTPILFGGQLMALEKKSGGIRPLPSATFGEG
jgi:hypothetical protein